MGRIIRDGSLDDLASDQTVTQTYLGML